MPGKKREKPTKRARRAKDLSPKAARGTAVKGRKFITDNRGGSSRRLKYGVANMDTASQDLLRLRPVTFRYRRAEADGSRPQQFGLIAEEVADVFPALVGYDDAGAPRTVHYDMLPAMLLNELQRQERLLQAQATEIAALRAALSCAG